jgi:hypothetical protein
MNYDFALITLKAAVDGPGWLGLTAGTGDPTYALTTAGYPGEKAAGTMWQCACSGVAINFGGNQGVFTDIDQCQNQARGALGRARVWGGPGSGAGQGLGRARAAGRTEAARAQALRHVEWLAARVRSLCRQKRCESGDERLTRLDLLEELLEA